jgi:hypothetical protein
VKRPGSLAGVRSRIAVVLVVAACALAAPAAALADGDPASDVLPLQDVYLPYQPPVSAGVANALRTLLKETRAAGLTVKVALIATPTDLGAVPTLFGQPQRYAAFLGSEISFNGRNPLLVVMPAGYGAINMPPAATGLIQRLPSPGSGPDGLAKSAIGAVEQIAKASGHPVAPPKITSSGSSGGTSPAVVFGAPVALLVIAGLLMTVRRRTSVEGEREAEPEPTAKP